jgi:acetyltransferase-like isoleucine patch superfamily enzyme
MPSEFTGLSPSIKLGRALTTKISSRGCYRKPGRLNSSGVALHTVFFIGAGARNRGELCVKFQQDVREEGEMPILTRKKGTKSHEIRSSGIVKGFHHLSRRFYDPFWVIPNILTGLYSMWVRATYPFASLGHDVFFHYSCDLLHTERIRLGSFIWIQKDVVLHAQVLDAARTDPALVIEDHCIIARRSHIAARNRIHIERGVMLSASVFIQDYSHVYADVSIPIRDQGMSEGGRIRIGQGSWIGQHAAIICEKGELTLGRNCVVGVNAVVTRSAPPYSVLAGNPARIIKQYNPAKGIWVLGSSVATENGTASQLVVPAEEMRA